MLYNFSVLGGDSILYAYPFNRILQPEEQSAFRASLEAFIEGWQTHQKPVHASVAVFWHAILLCVDEKRAALSGCAKDAFVRQVRTEGVRYGVGCFSRYSVAWEAKGREWLCAGEEVKEAMARGDLSMDTRVYDYSLGTKRAWTERGGKKALKECAFLLSKEGV